MRSNIKVLSVVMALSLAGFLHAEDISNPYRNDAMLLGFWTALTVGEGIASTSDTGAMWSGVFSGFFSFALVLNGSTVYFDQSRSPESRNAALPTLASGALFGALSTYTFLDIMKDKDELSRFLKTFIGYNIAVAPGFITYQWKF